MVVSVGIAQTDSELGLDGGAVNTVAVQTLTHTTGQAHVALAAVVGDGEGDLNVQGSDNLGVGQLPDVDVVAAENALEILNVFADVVEVDVVGRGLQEDLGGGLGQGDGGLEDDQRDEEGDDRVRVHAVGPFGLPDNQRSNNDTNVAQSVTDDVEDHGVHAHIAVAVAVGSAGVTRLIMVVTAVRIAATSMVMGVIVVVVVAVSAVMVVALVVVRSSSAAVLARILLADGAGAITSNKRRALCSRSTVGSATRVGVTDSGGVVRVDLLFLNVAGLAGSNDLADVVTEAGRVDADVVDGGLDATVAVGAATHAGSAPRASRAAAVGALVAVVEAGEGDAARIRA